VEKAKEILATLMSEQPAPVLGDVSGP
jgi:hypothetical protein